MSIHIMIPAVNGTVNTLKGRFTMPGQFSLPGFQKDTEEVFRERLLRLGSYVCDPDAAPVLSCEWDDSLPEEGYHLIVTEKGASISVSTRLGYCRALETLFILLCAGTGSMGCLRITDMPRFARRSVMLDSCRHFFPAEEVKRIIEQASLAHMNMFHWHLSDDQGYRIESRRFPALNETGSWRKLAVLDPMVTECGMKPGDSYGGYYTEAEIRDVVAYAAACGVDVVPEIDLPGHSSAILAVFPQYSCSGEPMNVRNTFGVHPRILCAGQEETFSFLFQLIDEIAELFPSRYFHIGGDEAPKTAWKACPRCREKMALLGFSSYERLQCYFTERLADHLKKIGKTPICWNESAISGELDPEAVIQYWAEMGGGQSYCLAEAQKGRKFIFSNSDQFYCCDSYAAMSLGCTQQYEPNVKGNPVPDENVLGVEMPMWTEWTATAKDIEPQMFPRLLAVAECGWTKEKNEQNLLERTKQYLTIPAINILHSPAWEEVDIRGEKALKEIASGLVAMGSRYRQMAAAELAAGGEAGLVAAIEPDDTEGQKNAESALPQDPRSMIHAFAAGKMTAGFTEADIDKVTDMVLGMMTRRM